MIFSSIPFLYYFLPAVLTVYFLVPKRLKNTVLMVASLAFYAWGEPKYVFLMAVTILLFYFCGLALEKSGSQTGKKLWLSMAVVISLGFLAVFKYADFFISSFNTATGLALPLLKLTLPVGISFYTFQCLSYVIDVYRGNVPAQKNIISFAAYVAMFPQLIAGPIVRYVDVNRELTERQHSWENAAAGLWRFLIGLGKKVLLADNFGLLVSAFTQSQEKSLLFYWMYAVAFTLQIYFDFSGYSDMAIGLGRVMGFHFLENFNYPYLSKSITEFWRRWHISLGSWFRDYVYIPLGGNRVSRGRWVCNILVVWMLTGLWHGAAWNFVAWGLLFALLLMAEKWIPGLKKLPGVVGHVYVLLLVVLGFVLFNAPTLGQAGADIAALFGFGGLPAVTEEAVYYLRSYGVLFVLGTVGATPLVRNAASRLGKTKAAPALMCVAMVLLLMVCTAYLVDGSFSPFLYFRF